MKFIILTLCIFLSIWNCSGQKIEADNVIARVGKKSITLEDLQTDLLLNPQYSKRAPLRVVRRNQLSHLIENVQFQMAARKAGFDNRTDISPKLKYIEEHELLKAYLNQRFLDRIEITEQEMIRGTAKLSRKLRVQNLFVPDEESADRLAEELHNGENFESLAVKLTGDNETRIKARDLGYISFGDLDPEIEDMVYSLKINQISDPVKSQYGYHILRVTEVLPNDAADYLSSAAKYDMIRKIIQRRKADRSIRQHLDRLSEGNKIQINNRAIDVLVHEAEVVKGEEYQQISPLKPALYDGEIDSIRIGVLDILYEPAAKFKNQEITVRDFLNRLKEMPPLHRPYLKTRARMTQSIIDIIRNDLLLEEAHESGINKNPAVKREIENKQNDFLAEQFRLLYRSPVYRRDHKAEWEKLDLSLQEVKRDNDVEIAERNLFKDVSNADSIFVDAPTPLLIKNRYSW